MAKILLVIDCQYDFITGSLAVNGAEKAMNKLSHYISKKANDGEYSAAIATVDWHPITHCSFKENGGEWSRHCLQFSKGASIYKPILDALSKMQNFVVLTKGTNEDREEYSIFKNAKSNYAIHSEIESRNDIDEIDICGLCLDFCVINTIKDALKEFPRLKINVLSKYTPSFGNPNDAINFIKNAERLKWLEE